MAASVDALLLRSPSFNTAELDAVVVAGVVFAGPDVVSPPREPNDLATKQLDLVFDLVVAIVIVVSVANNDGSIVVKNDVGKNRLAVII